MDYPNSALKLQLDKNIARITDSPSVPVDRPKTDLAVQLARQFKNSVSFGNGGIRKNMDAATGRRFIDPKPCTEGCGKRNGCC